MTERQAEILRSIVQHYVKTASPVGSIMLSKHFNVSSATIRADMAELEEAGFVTHPHTSAGRMPTDKGYRYYVDNLLSSENEKLTRAEQAIKQRLADAGEPHQVMRSAADSLVAITHNVGIASLSSQMYMSGLANLFNQPEFQNSRRVQAVARLLDNLEPWLREAEPTKRINVYIGSENPVGKASGCSLIVSRFVSPFSERSYVGVLGPTRQRYSNVIRLVKNTSKQLEEMLNE